MILLVLLSPHVFQSHCDYVFSEKSWLHPASVTPYSAIYLEGNFRLFFDYLAPRFKVPFILVNSNTDLSFPSSDNLLSLENPNLLAIFTINWSGISHPKIHPIPLGVSNTLQKPEPLPKIHLLYCNFRFSCEERKELHSYFKDLPFTYFAEDVDYSSYIRDLASSKFVLAPRGHGLDTYRLWETLYAGSYPIVRTSSLDSLYEDLPIVIINDWSEVTEEFLDQKYDELQNKSFSYEKLDPAYWLHQIDQFKSQH